jgi:hypothetical protein
MKKGAGIALALVLGSLPAICPAKEPALTGMALQQIQAKDFETTAAVAFPAVMTVLQDGGFRIQDADKDTGLITAIGSAKSHVIWAPFAGFRSKKKFPIVSSFIEQRGKSITRIRLNFVMSTGKSDKAFTDEVPITDPEVYRDAFERIEKEIFVRQAMDVALPPTTAPVEAAPASIATVPSGDVANP